MDLGSESVLFDFSPEEIGAQVAVDDLDVFLKASFGGDRSEAGRYAANIRWQGQGKGGLTPKDDYKTLDTKLAEYPPADDELIEALSNNPIFGSGLGRTMREINKEISERERNSESEEEMLPMVVLSSYLGKTQGYHQSLNSHLRQGKPVKDSLRETLSEEDEKRIERLEREISELEEEQEDDDETDNSAKIKSLRNESDEIQEKVDMDAERIDADDWNHYDHLESDFDSQYGSITTIINGENKQIPKIVAINLMDEAMSDLAMTAPSNFRVYRGVDERVLEPLKEAVGTIVTDLGFCSTSLEKKQANLFPFQQYGISNSEKQIITILIPKGHRIVVPDPDGDRMGESEVILNRGTQFRVLGVNETGPILEVVTDETK